MALSVQGYNDKQHILLKKIIEKMASFEIDEKRFGIIKEAYMRALNNFNAEQPLALIRRFLKQTNFMDYQNLPIHVLTHCQD